MQGGFLLNCSPVVGMAVQEVVEVMVVAWIRDMIMIRIINRNIRIMVSRIIRRRIPWGNLLHMDISKGSSRCNMVEDNRDIRDNNNNLSSKWDIRSRNSSRIWVSRFVESRFVWLCEKIWGMESCAREYLGKDHVESFGCWNIQCHIREARNIYPWRGSGLRRRIGSRLVYAEYQILSNKWQRQFFMSNSEGV